MNEIYEMKLHDMLKLTDNVHILRVPGGWLYQTQVQLTDGGETCNMCFVPFDNGFMKSDPQSG